MITETGGTIVVGDDPNSPSMRASRRSPTYTIRLTKRPDGTVTIAVLTDGPTDGFHGGAPAVLEEIGLPGEGLWSGQVTTADDPESTEAGPGRAPDTRNNSSSWLAEASSKASGCGCTTPATSPVRDPKTPSSAALTPPSTRPAVYRRGHHTGVVDRRHRGQGGAAGGRRHVRCIQLVPEQSVVLKADSLFDLPLVRQGSKVYPATPHLLSQLQGPLSSRAASPAPTAHCASPSSCPAS